MKPEIAGWFPEANQRVLEAFIRRFEIKTVIEVGSFVGKSAIFFAERCNRVLCVDPFVMWPEGKKEAAMAVQYGDDFYEQFLQNIRLAGVNIEDKITPFRMTSVEAAEYIKHSRIADYSKLGSLYRPELDNQADLVYIDAAHDYESVKQDIQLWTPFARKFICGDDYDIHWPGVKQAVDEVYPQRMVFGNLWIAPILGI